MKCGESERKMGVRDEVMVSSPTCVTDKLNYLQEGQCDQNSVVQSGKNLMTFKKVYCWLRSANSVIGVALSTNMI